MNHRYNIIEQNYNMMKPSEISSYFYLFAEHSEHVFWIRSADYSEQLYVNVAFEKIWGRSCEDCYNFPEQWTEWLHPDDKLKLELSISKRSPTITVNTVFSETYRIIRPTGEVRWIADKSFPLFDKNTLLAFAGISVDITESKETQKELEKAVKEKEKALKRYLQFVEDQEHDVRTPISGLVSSAESLVFAREQGMSMQDDLVGEMIECMQASSQQAQDYQESVIFDLYAGKFEGRTIFARFDLPDLTRRAFDFDLAAAKVKKLEYAYSYDENIPAFLVGDGKRVYQCILDLLGNAIQFTDSGKVDFSVNLLSCTEKQAVIRFRVTDTGIGIPEDKLDSIHQDFVKLKASNRGGERGRGLGLSRVYRYAASVDGELNIESSIGTGSIFSLVISFNISLDQSNG